MRDLVCCLGLHRLTGLDDDALSGRLPLQLHLDGLELLGSQLDLLTRVKLTIQGLRQQDYCYITLAQIIFLSQCNAQEIRAAFSGESEQP